MEVKYTCPLGHKCETAEGDILYRCRWFVKLRGKDPQSDEALDEFRCSMEWAPLLAVEHSMFERQTGAAVESLRNTVTKQNEKLLGVVHANPSRLDTTA